MRYCHILMLAAALICAPASAATPNMKDGLWEITMKMDMPGMPAGMKPQVMQQCITKKDLEDPRRTTPGNDPNSNRCQVTDHKVQGNTATWNMACKGEGAMTGSGTVTYSGDSYTGTTKMTMNYGGQAQNVTMHYSGRRIGECRK